MEKVRTLTINGNSYQIADGEAVLYTEQELTYEQKERARDNINAYGPGIQEIIMAKEGDFFHGVMYMTNNGHCDDEDTMTLVFDGFSGENIRLRGIAQGVQDTDAVNKKQLDAVVGDIETALDGILAIQNSLIGGDSV